MSVPARVATVFVLLLGAVIFVLALQYGDLGGGGKKGENKKEAEEAVVPGPPAKPGVLDTTESCKKCHPVIYKEWESNFHGKAWTDPLFRQLSKDYTDPSCYSCHAPRPVHESGFASAEARRSDRVSGINCLSCHKKGNHVVGPIKDPQKVTSEGVHADCGPAYDPSHAREDAQAVTTKYCGVCHNLHGVDKEFNGSIYAREGDTCLTCHMPEVVRPIAVGGKPRKGRSHALLGAHSVKMLKEAMSITAKQVGDRVVARCYNKGAGHRIPTDARHRAILVRVSFTDAYGQPVLATTDSGEKDREVTIDLIRLFYRQEQREPTQVYPRGTVGKNNWRESSIKIPPGAKGGVATVKLYYLLVSVWPPDKGVVVDETEVKLD